MPPRLLRPMTGLGLVLALAAGALAAVPTTTPPAGLRENQPTTHALVDARIVVAPGKVIEKGALVIRDGVITAVGDEIKIPTSARIWKMAGKTLYAGLVDLGGDLPASATTLAEGGARYWNSHITPEARADRGYRADEKVNEKLRGQGITVRLVAPTAGIIHGTSVLVSTGQSSGQSSDHGDVLRDRVALHLKVTTTRRFHEEVYPNSPMGALALVRQAFYDARWSRDACEACALKPSLPRPQRSEALDSLAGYLDRHAPVVIEAGDNLYFLRAAQVAKEFDLDLIVRGSGEEYQLLEAIKQSGAPVLVPVNFPKVPDVIAPEKALGASLAKLMHWDLAPENPARLEAAGVKIALTTAGLKDPGTYLAALRRAVARGLSTDAALRAVTVTPAALVGMSQRLGTLEAGKDANIVVTDGDLFAKKTKVLETWVGGRQYKTTNPPIADVRGTWELKVAKPDGGSETLAVKLTGEPHEVSGTIDRSGKTTKFLHVGLEAAQLRGDFKAAPLGWEGVLQLSATILPGETAAAAPSWFGFIVWADGQKSSLTARRTAAYQPEKDKPAKDEKKDGEEKKDDADAPHKALFDVNYPFGEYGSASLPAQPKSVVFTHATVWTCGPQGILEDASVLVESGKITAVGKDLPIPDGATLVDAKGKHVTPGLIDCHSHIATDGGVNEAGQTITAEVRIGDFIDHQDVNIYRQLAGGVTCANILHGSANTIGGQCQPIKFRWGALPEELKLAGAPPSIKFALGENVKQSNWGSSRRYPQTRMGVEQLVRDAFESAIEYRRRWNDWRRTKNGLPPRIDLELEAISEVVTGKRLIHCHAYRQDEILALVRTCEDYNVRIATFQHILEGYKVADVLAKHGVGGSSFSDWWAYKFEVMDAIPYNGSIMRDAGVLVSFNSDDAELARRLNLEAAKAVKYGGVPEAEALKFVTLNPARQMGVERQLGSLEAGKDADLVVWSGPPMSVYSRCEQTWVDGREFFNRQQDQQRQAETGRRRAALIQRALASSDPTEGPDDDKRDAWPREDIFCHHGDDDYGHDAEVSR